MKRGKVHSLKQAKAAWVSRWGGIHGVFGYEETQTYQAFKDGPYLAALLNAPSPRMEPVEQLQLRLLKMTREAKPTKEKLLLKGPAAVRAVNEGRARREKELQPINAILRQYPWIFQMDGFYVEGPSVREVPDFMRGALEGYEQVRAIVNLARVGMLDLLRKCAYCDIWFFASRPKNIFHSTKCQQAKWRSTPQFKEHNRNYQREHYRNFLSPKTARHLRSKSHKKRGAK